MAQQPIDILKSYFVKGAYPTEQQFADLIDSIRHKSDEISISDIKDLWNELNKKANASDVQKTGSTFADGETNVADVYFIDDENQLGTHSKEVANGSIILSIINRLKALTPAATYSFSGGSTSTFVSPPTDATKAVTLNFRKTQLGETTYPNTSIVLTKTKKLYTDTAYSSNGSDETMTANAPCNNKQYTIEGFNALEYGAYKWTFSNSGEGGGSTTVAVYIVKPIYYWFSTGNDATVNTNNSQTRKTSVSGMDAINGDDFDPASANQRLYLAAPHGWSPASVNASTPLGGDDYSFGSAYKTNVQVGDDATNLYDIYRTDALWANTNGITFKITGSSSSSF